MTPRRLIGAMIAGLALTAATDQPRLVPDVSQRSIDIRYSFSGAELLLFGAIVHPGGRAPDDAADIVVVLKGPSQSILVREKRKVAGIWVNADSARFRSAPSFYAIGSSRPIRDIVDERTAAIYELGLDKLQLSPSSLNENEEIERFSAGLDALRRKTGVYVEETGNVEITDGVLYRARLPLSARVIEGVYTAETFLVSDGRVLASSVRTITVQKSGVERAIAVMADRHPIAYGLTAIVVALGLGLAAAAVARRIGAR